MTTVSITITDDKQGRLRIRSDMFCDTGIEDNNALTLAFQIIANLNALELAHPEMIQVDMPTIQAGIH